MAMTMMILNDTTVLLFLILSLKVETIMSLNSDKK